MLRSMYAGISGLKNFQTKLDVIGNNIANVNTPGFKKGRVTFQDMMSQTTRGAQAPTNSRGGVNPMQVGLGSQMGSIDNIHTQGFRQTTGNPLDFAIEGDGMFLVAEGNISSSTVNNFINNDNISKYYTRAGNFYLDEDGDIITADGNYLIGYGPNGANDDVTGNLNKINIPESAQSFSVALDGTVNYVNEAGQPRIAGRIALVNFSNPAGLEKAGSNLFLHSQNAGDVQIEEPGEGGTGTIVASALEMSNVDLAEEFTEMITAQRGFQANTRIITTSDEILQELVNLKR